MIGNEEEIKYKEIINTLHSLQKVTSPSGFEADLMRKINYSAVSNKKSFFRFILSPSRLIPAAAALSAVILLFVFNPQAENAEDPLVTDPRVREDIISTDGVNLSSNAELSSTERYSKQGDSSMTRSSERYTASTSKLFLNKSGLNFRQVRLSSDEREQLNKLKAKIKSLWGTPANR